MATGDEFFHKVFITPRIGEETYGAEVEVTNRIFEVGIGKFGESADSQNYGVGILSFGDLELKATNSDGFFNLETDWRSMFNFSRDLAKARVEFITATVTRDDDGSITSSSIVTQIVFKGFLSDEATREDPIKETIRLKILSRDSVLKRQLIPFGLIPDGFNSTDAFKRIFNRPAISKFINFDPANIVPAISFTIDVGNTFDNITILDAVKDLLLATDSILKIDSNDDLFIKSRDADNTISTLELFAHTDLHGRGNIIQAGKHNNGRQRLFTSIKINDTISENKGFIKEFGFREKSFSLDFITNAITEKAISDRLVQSFRLLREELEITISTVLGQNVELLQPVKIHWPLQIINDDLTKFIPYVGQLVVGDSEEPLPREQGNLRIDSNKKFKIMEIKHNPKNLTTKIKVRHDGDALGEGYFV